MSSAVAGPGEHPHATMRRKEFLVEAGPVLDDFIRSRTWGTLAMVGPDGLPYGLPLSFAWHRGVFVFHGAAKGRKAGALVHGARASFTVVEELSYLPSDRSGSAEACESTQFFRSAIAEGQIEVVTEVPARLEWLRALTLTYEPAAAPAALDVPEAMLKATAVWLLRPAVLRGKFKLGQNMGLEERQVVLDFLRARDLPVDRLTLGLMAEYPGRGGS